MRKESYLQKPPAVEAWPVNTGTDLILRRNMELIAKEETNGDKATTSECWECEEVQYRYKGIIKKEDVEASFDYWWAIAEGKTEIEASDEEAIKNSEPTIMERLEALEGGLAELAEVIING